MFHCSADRLQCLRIQIAAIRVSNHVRMMTIIIPIVIAMGSEKLVTIVTSVVLPLIVAELVVCRARCAQN